MSFQTPLIPSFVVAAGAFGGNTMASSQRAFRDFFVIGDDDTSMRVG